MSLKCFLLILRSRSLSLFLSLSQTLSNTLKTTDDADDAAGHKSFTCAAVQTGFCDWSARYFAQPVMKVRPESCPSQLPGPTGRWSPHSALALPYVLAAASCSW